MTDWAPYGFKHRARKRLVERDGPGCWYCGADPRGKGQLTIDHIVKRSEGGSRTRLSNLRLACKKCNYEMEKVPREERKEVSIQMRRALKGESS